MSEATQLFKKNTCYSFYKFKYIFAYASIAILGSCLIQYMATTTLVSAVYFYMGGSFAALTLISIIFDSLKKKPSSKTVIERNAKKEGMLEIVTLKVKSSNPQDYLNWLFAYKHKLYAQQQEILKLTLANHSPKKGSIYKYIMIRPEEGEDSQLDKVITDLDVVIDKEWAHFDQEDEFFVDFANAQTFGGGYRTGGCVQEEREFWANYELAHMGYAAERAENPIKIWEHVIVPHSFIIPRVRRHYDLRKVPYGLELYTTTQSLHPLVRPLSQAPRIHIIGLAALDWRGQSPKKGNRICYSRGNLLYHYKAAFFAFQQAAKLQERRGKKAIVHTGAWGCGAFLNSEKTMTLLQIIAAANAGVKIIFHGVDTDPRQPHMTTSFIQSIEHSLKTQHMTANKVIDFIFEQQMKESAFRIKLDESDKQNKPA